MTDVRRSKSRKKEVVDTKYIQSNLVIRNNYLVKEQTGFKEPFTDYQPFQENIFEPKITKSCIDCKKQTFLF